MLEAMLDNSENRLPDQEGEPRRDLQPIPVLMVNDDRGLCRSVQDLLRTQGYAVITEHTLAHGRLRLVRDRFCAALLDIVLPDGDGRVALSEFRVLSGLPILMMTGTGDDETRALCLAAGAAGYLTKSFIVSNRDDATFHRA
jgi:DNA-binding response OmpR family regulator